MNVCANRLRWSSRARSVAVFVIRGEPVSERFMAKRAQSQVIELRAAMEFERGQVARETQYFGDPFEASAWRSRWVELMKKERSLP
jgi:hypothetical protein